MTLGTLVKGNTIQGNIAISVWFDGEEIDRMHFTLIEDLKGYRSALKGLLTLPVKYVFCNGAELVIEVEK